MKANHVLLQALLPLAGLTVAHLADPTVADAQSLTTGAVQGIVSDSGNGDALVGVTVTVTSPALQGAQTAITDDKGFYKITDLPPGQYLVTFYYLDFTIEHGGVTVGIQKTTPVYQKLDLSAAASKGEKIIVRDTAPTIDPTSTTQGITIDKNYIKNVPVPGRTFEAVLGAAAGSQSDGAPGGGVSFSGSTSLENQYYVDGVNTTGLSYGTIGSPVINDFIEEIEIITGGYNAEYGRATGGVVNVVTKSGSNEFKGSIFGSYTPGQLTAPAEVTPTNASSINLTGNNAHKFDFGFELGGPIIKDKLWFFVGVAPSFQATDVSRDVRRQTDCRLRQADNTLSGCDPRRMLDGGNADGVADVDPKTGFYITDLVDSEIRTQTQSVYNIIGKLNYAATPENQGQLTIQALPGGYRLPGLSGLPTSGYEQSQLTTDVSAKWTSKFNDNKTEVEAIIGWHRDQVDRNGLDSTLSNTPYQILTDGNIGIWGNRMTGLGGETQRTSDGCTDNTASDPYPGITNCPVISPYGYAIGGPGSLFHEREERRAAKLAITQRVKAGGSHEIKAGIDAEDNTADKSRLFSGGVAYENVLNTYIRSSRWVQLLGQPGSSSVMNNTDPRFDNTCSDTTGSSTLTFVCDFTSGVQGSPGTQVLGNTFNWSAYVRDSWQIQPNLTLNYGVRYEEQRMRYASFLQDTTDALTGDPLGKNALVLTGMIAPRIGLIYDWTKEGRSKLYAHWGRFYESIPMDINERSFGGEVTYFQYYRPTTCGMTDPKLGGPDGNGCGDKAGDLAQQLIGASGVLIAPGTQPEYMDEFIAGFEYEVLDDLKIGVSYQNRRLGRVIEDMSTDGAQTYLIGNPGEWSAAEEQKLSERIMRTDNPDEKARLQHQLSLFQGIRIFDKPQRNYNALQFTLTRRFSKKLYVQASYTYSRVEGNYPGSYSPDNGQVDPNISSQYDLIELLSNRFGPLPTDRPHYIKLDGYYVFDLKKQGDLTIGARVRALSGVPENALGSHYLYGPNESFLLPRGELGRNDFEHGVDLHAGYGRQLNKNMKLELLFDVYNIYDRQGTALSDSTYAPPARQAAPGQPGSGDLQNANPISGGTYSDLIFLKTVNANGGETGTPIGRNPNFNNTIVRYAPTYVTFGARLTF